MTRESVSVAVFNEACSPEDTKHVQVHAKNEERWEYVKQILSGPEKCIVVDQWILTWECVFFLIAELNFDQFLAFLRPRPSTISGRHSRTIYQITSIGQSRYKELQTVQAQP